MVKHLIRSTQDAGIVQDTLAGEAGEGEEETTGDWRLLLLLRPIF